MTINSTLKKLIYALFFLVSFVSIAYAIPFTPQGNIDLINRYGIKNVTSINLSGDIIVAGNVSVTDNLSCEAIISDNISTNMRWTDLYEYPQKCPVTDTFMTAANDSITCTAISAAYYTAIQTNTLFSALPNLTLPGLNESYYHISVTYNKTEVDEQISGIDTTSSISMADVYVELLNYYNKTEAYAVLLNYVNKTELDTQLQDIYNETEINTLFTALPNLTLAELNESYYHISVIYNKTEVDTLFTALPNITIANADALHDQAVNTTSDVVHNAMNLTGTNLASYALWVFRNQASAVTNAPVVFIEQDNAGDDQVALTIQQDGTANALTISSAQVSGAAINISTASSVALSVGEKNITGTDCMIFKSGFTICGS